MRAARFHPPPVARCALAERYPRSSLAAKPADGKTDDPKVKEKLAYIYTYGISMFKRGYISQDALKDAVLNNVASRVGMDGPAFDQWLEIPAVQ